MRTKSLFIALLIALSASVTLAQSSTQFLAIPASGFTPRTTEGADLTGYDGNMTGTARFFSGNFAMFAPVHLPHGATVTSLRCGGRAPFTDFRVIFTLRRNQPQQANVDMATAMTAFGGTGFQFVTTTAITSPVMDNRNFNYYIVAETNHATDIGFCPTCSVGFCRIGYTAAP